MWKLLKRCGRIDEDYVLVDPVPDPGDPVPDPGDPVPDPGDPVHPDLRDAPLVYSGSLDSTARIWELTSDPETARVVGVTLAVKYYNQRTHEFGTRHYVLWC